MANKSKKPASKKQPVASEPTRVTRIKASDSSAPKKKTQNTPAKPAAKDTKTVAATPKDVKASRNPLTAIAGYFKGSWHELRQVRWPNRRTTWALTLAVLIFTAFFLVLVVLLDGGFQLLFEQILG